MNHTLTFIFIALITFFTVGCGLYEQDDYREYYVVESYLVANRPLPVVILSKTAPLEEEYVYQDVAVNNASVEVRLLNADSTIQEHYPYESTGQGTYFTTEHTVTVREQRLYQLFITLPGGDTIEAKTFVPGDFTTVNRDELSEKYTYQGSEQIEITTTPSEYFTDRQTYYIFTVNAEKPDSSQLTPFYSDLVKEQDNSIQSYYVNSSGIINEENYTPTPEGNITLKVPWLSIAFYGVNNVIANAIDDNMYDFLRSQETQTGGVSLSPGEIQNIRYNVNGGIGIFGSLASDSNRFEIIRSAPQRNPDDG